MLSSALSWRRFRRGPFTLTDLYWHRCPTSSADWRFDSHFPFMYHMVHKPLTAVDEIPIITLLLLTKGGRVVGCSRRHTSPSRRHMEQSALNTKVHSFIHQPFKGYDSSNLIIFTKAVKESRGNWRQRCALSCESKAISIRPSYTVVIAPVNTCEREKTSANHRFCKMGKSVIHRYSQQPSCIANGRTDLSRRACTQYYNLTSTFLLIVCVLHNSLINKRGKCHSNRNTGKYLMNSIQSWCTL